MKSFNTDIQTLTNLTDPGTKISIYLPVGQTGPRGIFDSYLSTAMNFLEKTGDKELCSEFQSWMETLQKNLTTFYPSKVVAIFYSRKLRLVIPLAHDLPGRLVVAKSFHIKPLLFVNDDVESGYLVHFNSVGVKVLRSNGSTHEAIEVLRAPVRGKLPDRKWPEHLTNTELLDYIERISRLVPAESFVQISCAPEGVTKKQKNWSKHLKNFYIDGFRFGADDDEKIKKSFNARLRLFKLSTLNASLRPLTTADERLKTPEDILRALAQSKLQKIFIPLETMKWGELDPESKSIQYNLRQLNHRDDDVLDDIAEMALKKGIEIRVINKHYFPRDCDIIAV